MIAALGWMIKRQTANKLKWNLSMVVNLRSRGIGRFHIAIGVFGNALACVVAVLSHRRSKPMGLRKGSGGRGRDKPGLAASGRLGMCRGGQ